MSTSARLRKHWDVPRMREALRGEGIDPRTWVTAARVESVEWDPALGWITTVRAYGSDLEGAELTCRQASSLAGAGSGEYLPMTVGAEVLVELSAGSTEDGEPLVLGGLTNEEDNAPTTVNGLPIDGDSTSSSATAVSPYDTEIKVSTFGRREQYAKARTIQALQHVLIADQPANGVLLGSDKAKESFVLGDTFIKELILVIDGILTVLPTGVVGPLPVVFNGLAAFLQTWNAPVVGLKALLMQPGVTLSVKIKGE